VRKDELGTDKADTRDVEWEPAEEDEDEEVSDDKSRPDEADEKDAEWEQSEDDGDGQAEDELIGEGEESDGGEQGDETAVGRSRRLKPAKDTEEAEGYGPASNRAAFLAQVRGFHQVGSVTCIPQDLHS
jgi:hypothetical protein